jgi:hypothetical protein
MLSGSEVALLDGTFLGKTLCAFEEQLHALTTAKTAYCTCISCQFISPLNQALTGTTFALPIS